MFNNGQNEEIGFIDILTLISFIAQLESLKDDFKEIEWIHTVVKVIANEIDKLHKENDLLIEKVDRILELLERGEN